ncbi:MAG: hypothetical protein QXF82_00860 [Nitrososphaeria archaeon]
MKEMKQVICLKCGRTFSVPISSRARYCAECRGFMRRNTTQFYDGKKTMKQVICCRCSKPFMAVAYSNARYCPECLQYVRRNATRLYVEKRIAAMGDWPEVLKKLSGEGK